MGFNATVVVNLDQLNRIEEDPTFGKGLSEAILRDHRTCLGTDGPHGTKVVFVHHSSTLIPFLVGGGTGQMLSGCIKLNPNESQEETEVRVLKEMARSMGYRVSKIKKK
jgi:hypothetical protein